MKRLDLIYFLGNFHDGGDAALETGGQRGLCVGLFLEYECGEQGDDLFGSVVCQDVFEDEFGQDELVGGVDP